MTQTHSVPTKYTHRHLLYSAFDHFEFSGFHSGSRTLATVHTRNPTAACWVRCAVGL